MDRSMPGFPVLHHLPEFAQTHVHWVADAFQPSHPLSLPSPPVLNLSQLLLKNAETEILSLTSCRENETTHTSTSRTILHIEVLEEPEISVVMEVRPETACAGGDTTTDRLGGRVVWLGPDCSV